MNSPISTTLKTTRTATTQSGESIIERGLRAARAAFATLRHDVVHDVIRARRIVVVGADDEPRITLCTGADGTFIELAEEGAMASFAIDTCSNPGGPLLYMAADSASAEMTVDGLDCKASDEGRSDRLALLERRSALLEERAQVLAADEHDAGISRADIARLDEAVQDLIQSVAAVAEVTNDLRDA